MLGMAPQKFARAPHSASSLCGAMVCADAYPMTKGHVTANRAGSFGSPSVRRVK
jgi:hypothetical protein